MTGKQVVQGLVTFFIGGLAALSPLMSDGVNAQDIVSSVLAGLVAVAALLKQSPIVPK